MNVNIFELKNDLFFPLATGVELETLGDESEDIGETIAGMGFARVGGGAAPVFHIEQAMPSDNDLDSVPVRWP